MNLTQFSISRKPIKKKLLDQNPKLDNIESEIDQHNDSRKEGMREEEAVQEQNRKSDPWQ